MGTPPELTTSSPLPDSSTVTSSPVRSTSPHAGTPSSLRSVCPLPDPTQAPARSTGSATRTNARSFMTSLPLLDRHPVLLEQLAEPRSLHLEDLRGARDV